METINNELDNLIWKKVNHPEITKMEISESGHLRRINSKIIRIGTIDNNGYRSVKLGLGSKSKKFLVHRLVAMTFYADNYNPEEKMVVDHLDENKLNNHYKNIQFISHRDNVIKSRKMNNITGYRTPSFTDKEVRKCRKLYRNGMSIWNIWSLILNKKANYVTVLHMLQSKTYKDIK